MRTPDATGDIRKGGSTYYPTNSIEDRKLIDNPYETNNGSDFLIVKFNPADASHFLGNVGKKFNLEPQDQQRDLVLLHQQRIILQLQHQVLLITH